MMDGSWVAGSLGDYLDETRCTPVLSQLVQTTRQGVKKNWPQRA